MIQTTGRMLIILGFLLIVAGGIFMLFSRFSFHLPGDIIVRKRNIVFYFPLATSILLSIILTLVLNLIFRVKR